MFYVREISFEVYEAIPHGKTIVHGEGDEAVQIPYGNWAKWSPEERAHYGVTAVEPAPIPAGKVKVGDSFALIDGVLTHVPILEDEPPYEVRKLLIIDRLVSAGLFEAAIAVLGGPGDLAYERWQAATAISSQDAEVRALLSAIGADPDVILAPE